MSGARINFIAATATAAFGGLSLLLFIVGYSGNDPHAGLWGLFWAAVVLPFAPAFWLAGRAWARGWQLAAAVQLLPLAVLVGLICFFRWWASLAAAPTVP